MRTGTVRILNSWPQFNISGTTKYRQAKILEILIKMIHQTMCHSQKQGKDINYLCTRSLLPQSAQQKVAKFQA